MSSCVDIPTLTTTILQTTSTPSTTLNTLTTTLPPTESFITATTCTLSENLTCAGSTIVTSTTTIPGATQILTNTISTDVPVTLTQTSTLFSHSCTTTTSSTLTTTSSTSESSTTSTIITSESTSTLPNGSMTIISTTVTVNGGNTTITSPPMQNSDTGGGGSSTPKNLGAIIGGVVGGFFGLVALVLIIWFIVKRRRRWDDIFDHDEALGSSGHNDRRFSLSADLDGEPKPYQYGLVGLPGSSPAPHNSPPLHAAKLGSESSYAASTAYSGVTTDPHQQFNRGGSFSPLNLPPGAVATGMPVHTPSTMSASRPSTAGSTQPLTNNGRPMSQHGMPAQQQGVYQQQQNSYPPAMQQYYQQHQRGQSSATGHSATPSLNSPPLQPLTGWLMNTGVPNNPQPVEDPARSGSPMSYQEPRRLQIANYRDSVASPIDEESPRRTSMSTSQGGITPFTATSEPPQRDGKGRLRTSGSGNVVVHTDGGRMQQSTSQPASSSAPGKAAEPAPPAYSEQ